jgi:hypothetical protein
MEKGESLFSSSFPPFYRSLWKHLPDPKPNLGADPSQELDSKPDPSPDREPDPRVVLALLRDPSELHFHSREREGE